MIPVGIVLTAVFILAGCASKKNIWGDTKKGLILSYRMPEAQSLKYGTAGDVIQNMAVMDQEFEITMKSFQVFSFSTNDPGQNPMTLDITIDTMYFNLKTPMNELTPDMEQVIGKQFDIKLTPLGLESDFSQAKEITYDLGGESRNMGAELQGFFPNFPDKPLQQGDSWTYSDTIKEESQGNWLHLFANNTATLEGYEVVDGRECAKVTITLNGTVLGEGMSRGVGTKTTGEFSGTDTYFFDYKEGLLVKMRSEGEATTETKTSGEKKMTIPASREYVKEVWLEE